MTMNLNNYTIKSQEVIQQAQQLAQGLDHQQIENEHILKAIFNVDENVIPYLLMKLNVNVLRVTWHWLPPRLGHRLQ